MITSFFFTPFLTTMKQHRFDAATAGSVEVHISGMPSRRDVLWVKIKTSEMEVVGNMQWYPIVLTICNIQYMSNYIFYIHTCLLTHLTNAHTLNSALTSTQPWNTLGSGHLWSPRSPLGERYCDFKEVEAGHSRGGGGSGGQELFQRSKMIGTQSMKQWWNWSAGQWEAYEHQWQMGSMMKQYSTNEDVERANPGVFNTVGKSSAFSRNFCDIIASSLASWPVRIF